MKKLLIVGAIMLVLPFATFAHGGTFADADEQTATTEEMMKEELNHTEMEGLMKTFMVDGKLSESNADLMLKHLNELLSMGMKNSNMGGGMMGEQSNTMGTGAGTAGHHGNTNSDSMMSDDEMGGGMMGGGMMWMNLLHGLVGITSIVWLIAGVLYLANIRRQYSIQSAKE